MAEQTTKKRTSTSTAAKKPSTTGAKKTAASTTRARSNYTTVKNKSNVPAPSDKPTKKSAQSDKPENSKTSNYKSNTESKKPKKPKDKSVKMVPYILIVAAILLVMCFIANAVGNQNNCLNGGSEGDHPLGYVGYYLCEVIFGILGPAAYAIPLVLFNLAIFWKTYKENDKSSIKITLTVCTIIVTSALLHVFLNISDMETLYGFVEMYEIGAARTGGGILGGYIAWGLAKIGKVPLAIFLLIVTLIPLILFLVGTHPQAMIDKISAYVKVQRQKAAAEKAKREEDEKYEQMKAQKEEQKRQKKLEEQRQRAADIQRRQADDVQEKRVDQSSQSSQKKTDDSDDDVKINNSALIDDEDAKYKSDAPTATAVKTDYDERSATSERTELNCKTMDDEPEMKDEYRDDRAVSEETVINLDSMDDGYAENNVSDTEYSEENNSANTVKFVINKTENEPPIEDYGAKEEDFGGDLELTEAEGYIVDEVTGEIIGEKVPEVKPYNFPPFDLMKQGPESYAANEEEIEKNTKILGEIFESFRVKINDEIACSCGPTVTRYEIKPAPGVKVKQIANLGDDIAMGLAKSGVRIEAPIPGKAAVGVEVPNDDRSTVFLRNIIESPEFQNHKSKTAACLGADISGRPVVFDIEKMPHLLVAGTTGSGKSICINSIIMSILYKAKPSEVKLVLIDPKKVEFNVYKDIPHLSCKIVSDPKKAAGALNSAVNEMEKRFKLIEQVGVRNITGYNEITKNDPDMPYMPKMVIIIDELADLMMTAKEDVETAICRIAQKARAAGIHLILGTQRPSVDVITGLIKANVPSRIAFTVRSTVDSRTVIDIGGAEKLLGMGDMLYMPVGAPKPIRVQGSFVGDAEVEKIVDYIKANNDPVVYDSDFEKSIDEEAAKCGNPKRSGDDMAGGESEGGSDSEDSKFWEAIELAIDAGKISTSLLQRRLEIGYGRAAKIIDRLEERGFVGPADGNKPRKILVTHQDIAEARMKG